MTAPKIKLIYFKNLMEECFFRFFDLFQSSFTKTDSGYVFSSNLGQSRLSKIFMELAVDELESIAAPFDLSSPEYCFVIGGCVPRDNMLLKYRENGSFPAKLSKFVFADDCPKYVLKEKDAGVDMKLFNSAAETVFNRLFSDGMASRPNVFAIRHRNLDCYSVFKTLKYIFGRGNCVNMLKERYNGGRSCIVAVNDVIDKYVSGKRAMNRSKEFMKIIEEIREYAFSRINGAAK